jgi:2',3'-cyclic-nucleotide 2'-phosphodiesterase (5'-nucleotidase family)
LHFVFDFVLKKWLPSALLTRVLMRKFFLFQPLLVFLFIVTSCHTTYQPQSVQYKDYRITQKQAASNEINALLKPYSDSVNNSMNGVVAVAATALEKKQPEGTLGNVLADAMLVMARGKYQTGIDASFINFGGIRLPSIPAGNIALGKIYEVAPFDNIIVLLKLNGKMVQQLLDHVASRGGWPCAGVSWQIKNKLAVNIIIAGNALDENKEYTIALLDYIANGGDDCEMLKPIPQQNNGYLFRDAVIDYFTKLNKEGKQITASIEKRVTNAE